MTLLRHVDDRRLAMSTARRLISFIGGVETACEKVHNYHRMKHDSSIIGQVSVDMMDFVKSMIEKYPNEEMTCAKMAPSHNEILVKVSDST